MGGEGEASREVQEPVELPAPNTLRKPKNTKIPYSRYWNQMESGSPCSTSSLPPTLPLPSRMVILLPAKPWVSSKTRALTKPDNPAPTTTTSEMFAILPAGVKHEPVLVRTGERERNENPRNVEKAENFRSTRAVQGCLLAECVSSLYRVQGRTSDKL